MLGHVHSNSSNLLTLNYQLEHPGNLTIDLGGSGNNTQSSTNLTNTSNSPSSNLNDKTSANNHLLSSHSHLHHSSGHQLNHHQYAQLHHQPLINSNSVSIFAANQCENHQQASHQHSHHSLLQHGSPIMDLNSSYNGRSGQTINNSNTSSQRVTPNSNESETGHTVVVKSEDTTIYPLPDEEYTMPQNDGHLNCSSDQSYRADGIKLEPGSESNGLNNVTVSYSTAGYNGYDQLQLGNLSTQLILHPSSPLLSSTSHLQSALNNHNLHHPQSNHLLSGIHHSVIVENSDRPNEQTSSNGKAGDTGANDTQSNYNLTLMTAAAVTNAAAAAAGGSGLQHSVIQVSGSNSESFGLPPSKRSRKSQSLNNSSSFHSMDLEEEPHLHQSTGLNGQHQHLQTTSANSQMTADFNLCSENNNQWSMGDEYNYNYIYIPKI